MYCPRSLTGSGEPGTVTLTCECFEDGTDNFVDDTDTADFDCVECDVELDKQISCDGGQTYTDVGDDDAAARIGGGDRRPGARGSPGRHPAR